MAGIPFSKANAKFSELQRRLPRDWAGMTNAALARYIMHRLGGEEKAGIKTRNLAEQLNDILQYGKSEDQLSRVMLDRLMIGFDLLETDLHWFLGDDLDDFRAGLDDVRTRNAAPRLKLKTHGQENIWDKELTSDLSQVQGTPMGLVLSLTGSTIQHRSPDWEYGFSRISVVLDMGQKPGHAVRFEMHECARIGHDNGRIRLHATDHQTRPQFHLTSMDANSPIDSHFVSECLGVVVGAKEAHRLNAWTRVERKAGLVRYVGDEEPPEEEHLEIIACIFADELTATQGGLGRYRTLCTQELEVVIDTGEDANV